MNKIHFVYVTTNILTNKKYVGDHSTYNINDSYLGSGIYIQRAIHEYGKENFKREIIEEFPSKEEAFNAQEKYIVKFDTLSPNGYNISPKGGHNVRDCFSEETKQRISLHRKGKHAGKDHCNFGKHLPDKTKQKIGEKNKVNSKGENNGMFGTCAYKIWIEKYGKEEADKKQQIHKANLSISISGIKKSDEAKVNSQKAALKREKFTCEHCGKSFDAGNLKQHQNKLKRNLIKLSL
jgi:hypothetical protein